MYMCAVKIGMVGDAGVGKTSLMVRYVEKRFDQDYVETLGVNFMEKAITLPQVRPIDGGQTGTVARAR